MKPQRIQLSRRAGFNLQEASLALNGLPAVKVDRSTKWGNPFIVGQHGSKGECVYQHLLLTRGVIDTGSDNYAQQRRYYEVLSTQISELRGKNLACWCPISSPCHADNLLKMANQTTPATRPKAGL